MITTNVFNDNEAWRCLTLRLFWGEQSSSGWQKFAAGWTVGGLAGVAWCYILTQTLPYYF